jgi:hypothetical protein
MDCGARWLAGRRGRGSHYWAAEQRPGRLHGFEPSANFESIEQHSLAVSNDDAVLAANYGRFSIRNEQAS